MATSKSKDTDVNATIDVQRLWHIWNMNGPDLKLSCEICKLLQDNQCPYDLDIFLRNLPFEKAYMQDETLNRARIYSAFWKNDFEAVYKLIEENSFTNGKDLIDVWDLSHYYEEEMKRDKPLNPLARFRIRQRFIPPKSILPSGVRSKSTLPKDSKKVLEEWLNTNRQYPYPSRDVKKSLAESTGLSLFQVSTWFANARRKLFCKLRKEENTMASKKHKRYSARKRSRHKRKVNKDSQVQDEICHDKNKGNSFPDKDTCVYWYPSNQCSASHSFECSDVDCSMTTLVDKVNQSMGSTCFHDECKMKQEFWPPQYPDINPITIYPVARGTAAVTPTNYYHDKYSNVHLGNEASNTFGFHQEVRKDDAAEILINLSNRLIK